MLSRSRTLARPAARRQRGDILLVTLVFLLLGLLGLVASMRDSITTTQMAGNNLQKQKDTQVADLAVQYLRQYIATNGNDQPLQTVTAITSQKWWSDGGLTLDDAFWKGCVAANTCGSVPITLAGTTLPYTALAVMMPTSRQDDYGCAGPKQTANYYAAYVHLKEANGATNVNTETVLKVCAVSL